MFTDQLLLVLSSLFKDSMPWREGREKIQECIEKWEGRGKERWRGVEGKRGTKDRGKEEEEGG